MLSFALPTSGIPPILRTASTRISSIFRPKKRTTSVPNSLISNTSIESAEVDGSPFQSEESSSSDLSSHGADDVLPSYVSATLPSIPIVCQFKQTSPFGMTVSTTDGPFSRTWYHISVGANVWMPSSSITFLRRGDSECAPVFAQLEMGINASTATLTFGGQVFPLNQIMYGKGSSSNSRYHVINDGQTIKWKLGCSTWEACLGSIVIAQYDPTSHPQSLILQPSGHILFDYIVGDAVGMFNYRSYNVPE